MAPSPQKSTEVMCELVQRSNTDAFLERTDSFRHAVAVILSHGFSLTMHEATDVAVHYGYRPSSVSQAIGGNPTRRVLREQYDVELVTERQRGLLIYRDAKTPRNERDLYATNEYIQAVRTHATTKRLVGYFSNKRVNVTQT